MMGSSGIHHHESVKAESDETPLSYAAIRGPVPVFVIAPASRRTHTHRAGIRRFDHPRPDPAKPDRLEIRVHGGEGACIKGRAG